MRKIKPFCCLHFLSTLILLSLYLVGGSGLLLLPCKIRFSRKAACCFRRVKNPLRNCSGKMNEVADCHYDSRILFLDVFFSSIKLKCFCNFVQAKALLWNKLKMLYVRVYIIYLLFFLDVS